MLTGVVDEGHVVGVLVPKLSAAYAHTLAHVLSNSALHHVLVPLVFVHFSQFLFHIVRDVLRPVINLLRVKLLTLQFLFYYYFHFVASFLLYQQYD